MKNKKVLVFITLLIITFIITFISTKEIYANSDYLFEISIKESTTQSNRLTSEELIALKDPRYKDVKFDIYVRSIGANRGISGIEAGWLISNELTTYGSVELGDATVEVDRGAQANFFNINGSNSEHLVLADNNVNPNISSYLFTETEVRVASVYIVFNDAFTSDEDFSLSLDFINYQTAAFELTGIQSYDPSVIKINSFETEAVVPNRDLKTLSVGSQNILVDPNITKYDVDITYDESKLSINELIKYSLVRNDATATLSKSGNQNSINEGDIFSLVVVDPLEPLIEKVHQIEIRSIEEAVTTLKELNFNSDDKFSLDQAFSSNIYSYEMTIPQSRVQHGFTIKPIASSIHATIAVKINGQLFTSNQGVYQINNLIRGTHTLEILVTNNELVQVYEFTIIQKTYDTTAEVISANFIDQSNFTYGVIENQNITLNEGSVSYRFEISFLESTVKNVTFTTSKYGPQGQLTGVSGSLIKESNNLNKFKYSTLIPILKGEEHTITVKIIAEDNSEHYAVYIIKREQSSNTELKSVSVVEDNNTFLIGYVNNTYTYTVKNEDTQIIDLLLVGKDNEFSTIYLSKDNQRLSNNQINVKNLVEGTHNFEIKVVAQDGITETSYALKIIKLSSDTSFGFVVRQYGQNEIIYDVSDFMIQSNQYVLTNIPYSFSNLSFELTATDSLAKIEKISGYGTFTAKNQSINGNIQFTSTAEQTVSFTIRVTAANTNIFKEYEITLTRQAANQIDTLQELTLSNILVNNFIANIKPSGHMGLTVIDPSIVNSTIFLDSIVTQNQAKTLVTYQYKLQTSQNYITGQSITFERGKIYDVLVTVLSEAKTTSIYQFQFIVASSNNQINSIRLYDQEANEISLGYHKDTYNYTVNVSALTSRVKIQTILNDLNAKVITGADSLGYITLNDAGRNTVIQVYAQSEAGTISRVYEITIVRGSYRTSASISSLQVQLSNGNYINLNPTFQSNIFEYTLRIDELFSFVDISAEVSLNGETFIGGAKTYREKINLLSGETKTIQITVIAEDGKTINTYKIKIQRANNNTKIENIIIDGVSYDSLSFSQNVLNLGVIPYSKNSFNLEIILEDQLASYQTSSNIVNQVWTILETGQITLKITVTAQDGSTKEIYQIKFERTEASKDTTLSELLVESNIGNLIAGITPVISNNSHTYNILVNRDVVITNIKATTNFINATVNYAYQNTNLNPGGEKVFTITVTAEDLKTVFYYYIVVTQKNSNNQIESITINETLIDLNKEHKTYELGEFNYSNRFISLEVILKDPNYAKIFINNKIFSDVVYELKEGITKLELYVEAEDGSKSLIYTFNYKLNSVLTDNSIDTITIGYETTLLLNEQNFNQTNINVIIPNDFNQTTLDLYINASSNLKLITELNLNNELVFPLNELRLVINLQISQDSSINQTFKFTVKAENGVTKTYTVLLQRSIYLSENTDLQLVEILSMDNELLHTFNSFTQMQVNLAYKYSYIQIVVTTLDQKATVNTKDIYVLRVNEINQITFTVTAENKEFSKDYLINIFRHKASTDSLLSSLSVLDSLGNNLISFTEETKNYVVSLDRSHTSITIDALIKENQQVFGDLNYQVLSSGKNQFKIHVTAEDGLTKSIYIIDVNVKNSNNVITQISMGSETKIISNETTLRFMDVDYTVSNITIDLLTDAYATKYGVGLKDLRVGENIFEVYVLSEDGVKGQVYELIIVRLNPSSNNYLSELTIFDEFNNQILNFDKSFDKEITTYTINLEQKSKYSSVSVNAVAEHNKATIKKQDLYQLKELNGLILEIITVEVTAQDGSIRTYQIKLVKLDVDTINNDYDVYGIEVTGSDAEKYFLNQFDQSKVVQEKIVLPYSVNFIHLNVVLGLGATLSQDINNKIHNILPGETITLNIQAIAEDGTINPINYVLMIERSIPSDDNLLQDLRIDNETILDFDPLVNTYTITRNIKDNNLILINGTLSSKFATVYGLGEKSLVEGTNTYQIIVYAENNSQNIYTVIINYLSYENLLLELTINNEKINLIDGQYEYTINLDYLVSNVTILGKSSYGSKIHGLGRYELIVGVNEVIIQVESQAQQLGNPYIITINRNNPSDDADLSSLIVKDSNLNELSFLESFNKGKLDYIINMDSTNMMSVIIEATANHEYATVYNTGYHILEALVDGKYHTVIQISVVAQSGYTKTYTISFYRNVVLDDVIQIDSINLTDSNLVNYLSNSKTTLQEFDNNQYIYEISVPYSTISMNLEVITKGNVYGAGQKLFNQSNQIIYEFYIESISKEYKSNTYKIIISKEEVSNYNLLESLTINNQLIEGFDPSINTYELAINKENSNIVLIEAETSAYKISGTGEFELTNKENKFIINVTSESGNINTYIVTIYYVDMNAYLQELIVKTSNEAQYNDQTAQLISNLNFNQNEFSYEIKVASDTKFINLSGSADNMFSSKVLGFGTYQMKEDTLRLYVQVSSEFDKHQEVYSITIIKEKTLNSDTMLKELIIDGYDINFNQNSYQYKLVLPKNENNITIKASANSSTSKVSVVGYEVGNLSNELNLNIDDLVAGNNVLLIKVEAADGTMSYYRLNINKDVPTSTLSTVLLITAILLWVITVLWILNKKALQKQIIRKERLIK